MVSRPKSRVVSSVIVKTVQILPKLDPPRIVAITLFQGSFSQVRGALPDFDRQAHLMGL